MKLYISILLLLAVLFSCHQKEGSPLDKQIGLLTYPSHPVNQIAAYGRVDDGYIGIGNSESQQYKRYKILTTYSESTLLTLTKHESPVVRVYAFDALLERNSHHVLSVFKDHINDSASFNTLSGCIGSTRRRVNRYLYSRIRDILSKKEQIEYSAQFPESENLFESF